MKKKPIQTTYLDFDREGGFGDFGLSLFDSFNTAFCPVYNGSGIFHDLFEHGFEQTDQYFQGDAQLNVGGEITASGAVWYFFDQLKVRVCPWNDKFEEEIQLCIENLMKSAITHCCDVFGSELICNVPTQSPVESKSLETKINVLYKKIQAIPVYKGENEKLREASHYYKSSVTLDKIANLYRYGYRKAQSMAIKHKENTKTLQNFIAFWDEFCNLHEVDNVAEVHEGIEFRIFSKNGIIDWQARFIRKDEFIAKRKKFRRIPLLNKGTKVQQFFKPINEEDDDW